MNPLFP